MWYLYNKNTTLVLLTLHRSYFIFDQCMCHLATTRFISTIINRRYGSETLAVFRLCERIDRKHRKAQLDLAFLIQCRDHGVVPRFLNFKLANQHLRQSQTYEACRGRLLAQEIHHKRNNIKKLGAKLESTLDNLRTSVSYLDFQHLTSFMALNNVKSLQRSEVVQNQKLERLKQEYLSNGIDPDKVIFNFSSYELNDIEKKVLSRGLRFGIRPDKLNYCQILTPFENWVKNEIVCCETYN